MTIEEFIKRYKNVVDYDGLRHWLGAFVLTNEDMKRLCMERIHRFDYELRTDSEQRKIRERIFRELRGGSDG